MKAIKNPRAARGSAGLVLTLLFLAGILNFLDRSALSIANSTIRQELHLSATGMGALLSAFSLAYGFAQLPIGPALDRLGAKRILGLGLALWSVATALTGLVGGMRGFLVLRVMLGLGEAPFFPAALKLGRELWPAGRRGRFMAIVNISTTIGLGLAPPLLTVLLLSVGWRKMFEAIGCVGVVLAIAWWVLLPSDLAPDTSGVPAEPVQVRTIFQHWAMLFRLPVVWALMLGFGGINYTTWFYLAWLPAYLQTDRHISVKGTGWLAALPFLAGSAGMLCSGVLADRRVQAGSPATEVHRFQILIGMVLSALCTLLAVHIQSLPSAMLAICGALLCIHFAGTSAWSYVQAASPADRVATLGSVQNFGSFVIASAAPLLTGWTVDVTHSFRWSFDLCAVVTLAGTASYFLLVRTSKLQALGSAIPQSPAE